MEALQRLRFDKVTNEVRTDDIFNNVNTLGLKLSGHGLTQDFELDDWCALHAAAVSLGGKLNVLIEDFAQENLVQAIRLASVAIIVLFFAITTGIFMGEGFAARICLWLFLAALIPVTLVSSMVLFRKDLWSVLEVWSTAK